MDAVLFLKTVYESCSHSDCVGARIHPGQDLIDCERDCLYQMLEKPKRFVNAAKEFLDANKEPNAVSIKSLCEKCANRNSCQDVKRNLEVIQCSDFKPKEAEIMCRYFQENGSLPVCTHDCNGCMMLEYK